MEKSHYCGNYGFKILHVYFQMTKRNKGGNVLFPTEFYLYNTFSSTYTFLLKTPLQISDI